MKVEQILSAAEELRRMGEERESILRAIKLLDKKAGMSLTITRGDVPAVNGYWNKVMVYDSYFYVNSRDISDKFDSGVTNSVKAAFLERMREMDERTKELEQT